MPKVPFQSKRVWNDEAGPGVSADDASAHLSDSLQPPAAYSVSPDRAPVRLPLGERLKGLGIKCLAGLVVAGTGLYLFYHFTEERPAAAAEQRRINYEREASRQQSARNKVIQEGNEKRAAESRTIEARIRENTAQEKRTESGAALSKALSESGFPGLTDNPDRRHAADVFRRAGDAPPVQIIPVGPKTPPASGTLPRSE